MIVTFQKYLNINYTLSQKDFIAELYNRYGQKLYSYSINNWNLNEDDAWELVYKTLYKVIEVYQNYSFENEEKFGSFIFKILINYLRNHYQAKKNKNYLVEPLNNEIFKVADKPVIKEKETEKMTALKEELEKMEDWQRVLLLMRCEGRSYSEIALFVQKPENQLKVYYQRLKEKLSKKLNAKL